jgi:phosphoenolpyruvate carboxykinase (GTP)
MSVMVMPVEVPAGVNGHVAAWVRQCVDLCQPDRLVWLDGSRRQRDALFEQGVGEGVFFRLNQQKWPGCYYHRSNPNDVARTEHLTFICTPSRELAGPTNNWMDDTQAYSRLQELLRESMKGRTMYVIPFIMGPPGSPLARVGIELTDSLYVAVSMAIMTRTGTRAWQQLGDSPDFTRCLHSVLDCHPDRRYICHFPLDNTIWSVGSGYGGNALLGKKCLALRIAGFQGRQQGWMAEHMLLMGVESPGGDKTYLAGAFPSACGKTNLAMLVPPEPYGREGWKITTLGDDIAWLWVDQASGRLHAINPETGYFGVVPGTNRRTNPNAMRTIARDTIFTNTALVTLPDGSYDVWWEDCDDPPPAQALDWAGKPWTPTSGTKAAHPNSRFTAPMANNPVLDPAADDPRGVPLSAIIFGGRRTTTIPLVFQAFNWVHGVYVGATLGSETTAAATGELGVVRRDPMAMLPFIGYNVRDYLVHWLRMRKQMRDCPLIFHVNWFRKDGQGKFLWPGFGENMRILEWIVGRCRGRVGAIETPVGWMPRAGELRLDGLSLSPADMDALQRIDIREFLTELVSHEELFLRLAGEVPKELIFQRELLISRL